MLTIGRFLAKLTSTERHKESPITTLREASDAAEGERRYREAIQRGIDELVAQMAESAETAAIEPS